MQPSSLIFLVIIAIWAAYFIQHWVRRREHLATARSVDRFSESMRVLEHRAALPVADLSAPQPRSYAVSPARPARPEILVKRADRAPAAAEPVVASSAASAARAAASAPAAPAASGRRARGLTLLGSLAALLVTVGLCAFGVVPWLAVAAPVAAIAAVLVWMRQGAKAEQAARRAARAASGRAAAAGSAAGHRQVPSQSQRARTEGQARQERRTPRPAAAATRDEVSDSQSRHPHSAADDRADAESDAGAVDQPQVVTRESFYDLEAVGRGAAPAVVQAGGEAPAAVQVAPAVPLVDEDDIPLTWDPVPVPRPTYTMKAAAPRTQAPPVAPGVPPEMAEPAYEEQVWKVAGA